MIYVKDWQVLNFSNYFIKREDFCKKCLQLSNEFVVEFFGLNGFVVTFITLDIRHIQSSVSVWIHNKRLVLQMNMFSGFSVLRLKNGIFVGFQSYSSFGFCKRYVFEGIV